MEGLQVEVAYPYPARGHKIIKMHLSAISTLAWGDSRNGNVIVIKTCANEEVWPVSYCHGCRGDM